MTLNHEAIRRAYPQVVVVDDGTGAFDVDGNPVQLDPIKIDSAAGIVAQEQALETARQKRATAYFVESDPIFFKAQRGEATMDEWMAAVAAIKLKFPYPGEES